MMHVQRSLQKSLTQKGLYSFGLGKAKKPTPKTLDEYDVVFIGSNMGGLCSNHFERATDQKYKVMVAFENSVNQVYPLRGLYEMQKMGKTDYMPNAKIAVHTHSAHSDLVGVKQIIPEDNQIILKNGRKIGYNHLVVASGQQSDTDAISGFDAAWEHDEHPVYAPSDHPKWKGSLHKYPKYHYNFCSGDAYFCIPPFPFQGEIESYNFFISHEVWQRYKTHGKLHPHSKLTVVNANDRFVQHNEAADQYFRNELAKRDIEVVYNTNLVGIDADNYKITLKDVKSGKTSEKDYNNLYSLVPTKPRDFLHDAGLTADNGLLDVDRQTLRHNKYKNIFGLGDCINIPTTHSFWGGWQQIHVVRNNLTRSLNNQSLNALYDGYSKNPIYTSQNTMTFSEHFYDQKAATGHLVGSTDLLGKVRAIQWGRSKKAFLNYYLGKTWGPPYHKFKKTFKELPVEQEQTNSSNLQATRKSA